MSALFTRNLKRQYPLVKSASGSWIVDTDGNRYLDGCSGAIAANLGHGIKEIQDAMAKQMEAVSFAHTSQFISQAALDLAADLLKLAPKNFAKGRVYFTSGGSEAVETALKLARAHYFEANPDTEKRLVISRRNSYHGGTFGAMSITGHPARRKPYLPLLGDHMHIDPVYTYRCPCGFGPGSCTSETCTLARANELETAIKEIGADQVMAFIAEPIVGAALGAAAPNDGYWQRIREICTANDVLLIADEVMTGLGRCGANFALDLWNVQPDIIVSGKGLAAGYMPLAAVIASDKVVAPFLADSSTGAFEHGFTYSGHPLSCATGLAVITHLVKHNIVSKVAEETFSFQQRLHELAAFPFVGDIRGKGFLAGIEFVADKATKQPFPASQSFHRQVTQAAHSQGLLVYPGAGFLDDGAGDHILVAPPLNISYEDMDTLFCKLHDTFQLVSQRLSGRGTEVAK